MKDGLHLIGGMGGAMLTLAAYIFMWGVAMRCFGGERFSVTTPSGDGVNYVTTEVDENGYVESVRTTTAYVPQKYIPQSGERCVIEDMEYVLIAARDWERITNAVARLEAVAARRWANEHKTDAGRRAWHGALKEKRQSDDGRGMVYTYADGFTYTEEAEPGRRESPAVKRNRSAPKDSQGAPRPRVGVGLPPRLKAKREAISARPAAREVNATFGPGGKVLKVEGER